MMNDDKTLHYCSKCDNEIRYLSIYNRFVECRRCMNVRIKAGTEIYDFIKPNIFEIYERYKIKEEPVFLSRRKILDNKTFELLHIYLANNLNSAIWNDCMFGIYDSQDYPNELRNVGIMLTTEQAITLINLYTKHDDVSTNYYKFSHAIGPHILLLGEVLALKNDDGNVLDFILGRYYCRNKSLKEIKEHWGNISFVFNTDSKCIVNDCNICFKPIYITETPTWCVCNKCKLITHFRCKLKYFSKKNNPECEVCRHNYKNVNDLEWNSRKYIRKNGDLVQIDWMDEINKN